MGRLGQFIMFIFVYILIYGSMNAYMLMKARWAFSLDARATLWTAALCAFMVFAPILVRMLEARGIEGLARALAYISYTWFGLIFLFLSVGLLTDAVNLVAAIKQGKPPLSPMVTFVIPLALSVVIFAYGYFEGMDIKVERVEMTSGKLNHLRRKVRIAQISDIHVGLLTGRERVGRIVEMLRRENPDIIVCTGDLVDGTAGDSDSLAGVFAELKPRYGMFAVMGNHEYYAGLGKSIEFTEKAGFKVLRSEAVAMDSLALSIAGADFPARMTTAQEPPVRDSRLFEGLPEDNFRLLLKHVPYVESDADFDLQLSGHTHKGQIFPFALIVKMFYPRLAGLYYLGGQTGDPAWLYVSRGTGVWGPPIRVLSPPEITIIEISPETGR